MDKNHIYIYMYIVNQYIDKFTYFHQLNRLAKVFPR